jgi:hypothetical protein
VNGSPFTEQPQTLTCSPSLQLVVGWKFSNNVNGLTKNTYLDRTIARRSSSTGITTTLRTVGNRRAVYLNPATVSPYNSRPSRAYYDETANDGAGKVYLHRNLWIGTDREANVVQRTRSGGGSTFPRQTINVRSVQDEPLHELFVRTLERGRPLIQRQVLSGAFVAEFSDGAEVTTSVRNLAFSRWSGDTTPPYPGVCAARSGVVTNRIRGASSSYPNLEIVADRDMASTRNSIRFRCNLSLSYGECRRLGTRAMKVYGPPACLY